jgi:lipooligosaccharide transport system permease protein
MITLAQLPLRIVPPEVLAARRPQRMLERQWIVNRRGGWTILLTGFFEPLFYLLSVRVGFGGLDRRREYRGRSVRCRTPSSWRRRCMAAAAMNGCDLRGSTMNVFFKLKHAKLVRRRAGDADVVGRRGARRDRCTRRCCVASVYAVAFLVTMVAARDGVVALGRDARRWRSAC